MPREPPSSLAATQPAAGIERNAGGCEEPHSGDPELWNIDGTEVDLNAKYKVGGQMWYLQSRATDAIKGGKPIAGTPFNDKARAAGRLFSDADGDSTDESPTATPLSGAAKDKKGKADAGRRSEKATEYSGEKARRGSTFDNMLVQMLVERKVEAHEDTLEWACTRLKTLARLTPRRLVQHVVEQVRHNSMAGGTDSTGRAEVVPLTSYVNRTQCAGLFIDYTSLSKIPDETFRREGFKSMELLVERLNMYLGKIVDRLTTCGGDVIKFAGDAALVLFYATPESNLAYQVLKATQLSLECIADLEACEAVVEGVTLTAHAGIGVGRATGFLVGGVFNRSEYAVIGEPVFQIASAEPAAGNGETVISSEGWELIKDHAVGEETSNKCWLVTGIKADSKLTEKDLDVHDELEDSIAHLDQQQVNLVSNSIKQVVPGGVRNMLHCFTPTSIPTMSEFRRVTILSVRLVGLWAGFWGDAELQKLRTMVKLIQETVYVYDGIFLRFSVDDRGAVALGGYGLPPSHLNDPERAARAGLDLCAQFQSRFEEFDGVTASCGIATGYAWLGLVGGKHRCDYTPHAPWIDLAARLMCASDSSVLVDEATRDMCGRTTKKLCFVEQDASILTKADKVLPGLVRSLSANELSASTAPFFLVLRDNPSISSPRTDSVVAATPKTRKRLEMKLKESTVDADNDTQEWAATRLEVLSRLAPYRLLRFVLEQQKEQASRAAKSSKSPEAKADFNQLNNATLWVANICDDALITEGVAGIESKLADIFSQFGEVDTVTVREKFNDQTSKRAHNQSWALVTFNVDGGLSRGLDLQGAIDASLVLAGMELIVKMSKAQAVLRSNPAHVGSLQSILTAQSFKSHSLSSEIDQQNFFDRCTCAAMFIDISGFSKITEILFKKQGLDGIEVLADTLNTYLGKIVDRLTTCGGDVIKFAGDAALVLFAVTPETDLAYQALKATQLSLECIADLEAGEAVVEGVALTAHTGIGVGEVTGFLVGGVFNRSEYAVIGEPVFQIASAEPAAGNGETVISSEGWELIKDHAEGNPAKDNNWLVTGIKADSKLTDEALGTDGGVHAEILALSKEEANLVASEIKQVVPGGVRNVLSEFTPTSIPRMSEFRLVTMLFARIQGLDYSHGDVELKKIQTIIRLIQETIYKHDGIFLRFSVDDKGAVVMGVYGLPPSHENDPERGVMASLDFSRQIHAREEEFGVTISVGLTTGYCWLGLVGGTSRCEYTTHAPMINLAARLMCATENDILVDHATKEACMRTNLRAKFEGRPAIKAKGFDDPVKVYIPRLIATPRVAMKHWRKSAGVGPKRNDKGKA
eukprot:COSAG01_NODE_211_length_21847_cov_17.992781_8_plen_1325_part_00